MKYYPIQIVSYKSSSRIDISIAENWTLKNNGFRSVASIESKLNTLKKIDGFYYTENKDKYYNVEFFFFPVDSVPTEFKIVDYYKSSGGAGVKLCGDMTSLLNTEIPLLKEVSFFMSIVDFVNYCKNNEIKNSKICGTFKITKKGSRYFLVSK